MNVIDRFRRHWRRTIPALIVLIGVALTAFAVHKAEVTDARHVRKVLEMRAEWRASDFHSKMLNAASSLEVLSVSIASNPDISAAEFHSLAVGARKNDSVARLTWCPRVRQADRPAFERAAQQAGMPNYFIREGKPNSEFETASDRIEYLPVRFEALFEDRPSLLGYDMLSEAEQRRAAERARDEHQTVASPFVLPLTGPEKKSGYSLFWPVYREQRVPATVDARRAELLGFVTGLFRADEVMVFAIHDTPNLDATLSLFVDQPADAPSGTPLALYRPGTRRVEIGSRALIDNPEGIRVLRSFSEYGRDWTLVSDFPPTVIAALSSFAHWWYLMLGLLLTYLIFVYEFFEQRRHLAIEAMVAERTRDWHRTADQLKAIIDASPLAVGCVDAERCVTLWNRAAEQIYGYTADEVIGHPYPVVPDDQIEDSDQRFERLAKGEVLQGAEAPRRRKDGTRIDTRLSAAPFFDTAGKLGGIIFLSEDISERKQIERQLANMQRMETVGQLTGGLAHDFNNILGAVIGNLDLAEENAARDATATVGYCKAALDAALSAAELVKRLLAFSRRQPLRPEPTDLTDVLSNVLPLLTRTLGEHIRVETKQAPDLWAALADAGQVENAVLNLAVNARDAMPDGGVLSIEIANVQVDEAVARIFGDLAAGDYVTISITDTGTGIPPDVIAQVFEPFFTTKSHGSGSGLGLSMVFGTMKQLGGTAKIYSEVGIGTAVRLYLPKAQAGLANTQKTTKRAQPASTGHEHILMVEDNEQIRDVGVGILTSLGYRVTVVESADEAMRHIDAGERFDLLFSDIVMPGRLNGIALSRELRKRDASIPILLTSGFASPPTMREGMTDLGAELILKPYRKTDLAALIRSMLDKRKKSNG